MVRPFQAVTADVCGYRAGLLRAAALAYAAPACVRRVSFSHCPYAVRFVLQPPDIIPTGGCFCVPRDSIHQASCWARRTAAPQTQPRRARGNPHAPQSVQPIQQRRGAIFNELNRCRHANEAKAW
jgi:hypothetical protein